jgi:hypothetical protein
MFLFTVAEEDMLDGITNVRERENDRFTCSSTADYAVSNAERNKTGKESRLPSCNRLRPSFLLTAIDSRALDILYS